jgi:UDP-N-acetylmuramoylalanine--D-glutamate ligase
MTVPPHTLVVGLGKTGLSIARHLQATGKPFAVADTRAEPPGLAQLRALAPQVAVASGALHAGLLAGVDEVVVSPGLAADGPLFDAARARAIPVVGDIELFARRARAPVVGITGTNGKSTVTTLVGHMARRAGLAARVGGNLGEPALDLLDDEAALYVLELSSYQLDTTESLELVAATVLNVTPDHLDRYGSVARYAGSKARIFRRCGVAVLNADDPLVAPMGQQCARRIGFSIAGADPAGNGPGSNGPGGNRPAGDAARYHLGLHQGRDWLMRGGEPLLATADMRLAGRHNAANALAALALGEALGLPLAPLLDELREFTGLPHRTAWVGEHAGVRYINDSKGTNVGATLAAVAGLPGPLLLVAGGDGKGQDFAPLAPALAGKVRHALLIGRDARLLGAALAGACPVEYCQSLEAAVHRAAQLAHAGDTVLLSPACASLDMFRDYAHRGDVFAAAVRGLAA